MFCPECGQQQVSDEVRFCSRCGFQLAGVTGLLATRGALPAGAAAHASAETPRRKGVRQGGKLILFAIFLMPFFGILSEISRGLIPEETILFGVLAFMVGLLRLLYAALFEDGPYRKLAGTNRAYVPPAPSPLVAQGRGAAGLPPAQSIPARDYATPRADTAEISPRPSVTEGTTRLLDEQGDRSAR
jgi:hypothetical protein